MTETALDINGMLWCPQRVSGMAAQRCISFQDSGACTCETGQMVKIEWEDLLGGKTMKQGEKPEAVGQQAAKHKKRPDVSPPCSRCHEKPCNKNTWKRKWSGGVGLCLTCYDIVRKEEKGEAPPAKTPAPAEPDASQPASVSDSIVEPDSEDHPAAYKKPTTAPVLLKTFNDPDAARDFVTALEDAGVEIVQEIMVSIIPEEGRSHS